ncbi:hypothetical protein M3M33_13600 [Loigolactobacillus coryniformis]|uniref:hypothetical protein n=1 Tax=Loigolactobacillus coryniformis TaxID=1610 RepID=UPI00201A9856|nr:hypothetical protein [Loigolactobacillus coryniformis]MCL5459664.1 hypothetical protein [Loigolactobacillus coryniformis]
MIEIRDYRQLLKYGDIKKLCEITGLTPYKIRTGLAKADQAIIDVVETFYEKKLEQMRNQIYDYEA